jgi:hypothetical protein
LVRGKWDIGQVRAILTEYHKPFDGLEVYHSAASQEQIQMLLGLCKEFDLSLTVGGDEHGKFDKNFSISCPSDSSLGKIALKASLDTCGFLPMHVKRRVIIDQLLYWAKLSITDKTYSHILPIFSPDKNMLGRRKEDGDIILVTPEIVDMLIEMTSRTYLKEKILLLLRVILKNSTLDKNNRDKISSCLKAYGVISKRDYITKALLDDVSIRRIIIEEFVLSLLMDKRFTRISGFSYNMLLNASLKTEYNFSKDIRHLLMRLLASGPYRVMRVFEFQDKQRYVFLSIDSRLRQSRQDMKRLKRYYIELFDIALDIFVYLGQRMQFDGKAKDDAISSLSDVISRITSLKKAYSQDKFLGADFKKLAASISNRLTRTIELIEARNEPAANWCLSSAITRAIVVNDRFFHYNPYAYNKKESALESDWDEFRQKCAQIDFEISDRRWVLKAYGVISKISNMITAVDYELTPSEILKIRGAIDEVIESSVKPGGELRAEDKIFSIKLLKCISLMLSAGDRHIRTARIFLDKACQHLLLREKQNIGIIDAIGGIKNQEVREFLSIGLSMGKSHIQAINRRMDLRDRRIAKNAGIIIGHITRNDINSAEVMIEELSQEKNIQLTPEYAEISDITDKALLALREGRIQDAVFNMKTIQVIALYSKELRDVISFYRERLLSDELLSDEPIDRLALLLAEYNSYLDRNKKIRDSAKLSAIYWARIYQLANVSMFHKTTLEREHSSLFQAISLYMAILKPDFISEIYNTSDFRKRDLPNTEALLHDISSRRKRLIREDLTFIIEAIADDFSLSFSEEAMLKECVWTKKRNIAIHYTLPANRAGFDFHKNISTTIQTAA